MRLFHAYSLSQILAETRPLPAIRVATIDRP
jgi:hypothetical protein